MERDESGAWAARLGVDVVITDHHDIPRDADGNDILPWAAAIVNPKQSDCTYPWKEICGAVVAYKLIRILYERAGVPMSEWELCNIRVSTVLEHLRKQHLQIISWQDIPDIRPHILFRAADGAVCWVIVTSAESSEILPSSAEINKQLPDSPDEVRGYSARISLRSTKDLSSPPPRGDSFFINFTGLDPL